MARIKSLIVALGVALTVVGAKADSRELPDGYTQVDYIETTQAGQYIDTGYVPVANTDVELKGRVPLSDSNTKCFYWTRNPGGTYPSFGIIVNSATEIRSYRFDKSGTGTTSVSTPLDSEITYATAETSYTINGQNYNFGTQSVQTFPRMLLFVLTQSEGVVYSGVTYATGMRLYSLKITEGETVVRDFVPCVRNSDGAIGLYDLSGCSAEPFYANAGPGALKMGLSGKALLTVRNTPVAVPAAAEMNPSTGVATIEVDAEQTATAPASFSDATGRYSYMLTGWTLKVQHGDGTTTENQSGEDDKTTCVFTPAEGDVCELTWKWQPTISSPETIAFYPLDDQQAGTEAANGDTVKNAVDGKATGTIRQFYYLDSYKGHARFSDDIPGQYIYSDWMATNLLSSTVQSLHFQTNMEAYVKYGDNNKNSWTRTGGALLVREAAEQLADWGGDYTIEFFWKEREGFGNGTVNIPFRVKGTTHTLYLNYSSGLRMDQVSGKGSASYPASLIDNQWHHVAIIYDSAKNKVGFMGDYTTAYSNFDIDENPHVEGDAYGVSLGGSNGNVLNLTGGNLTHSDNSTKDFFIAAPRFSKGKLTAEQMMVALPLPIEKTETAFHWSLDGTVGETATATSNRVVVGDTTSIRTTDWFWANSKIPSGFSLSRYYLMGVAVTTDAKQPVYDVDANRAKACLATNGVIFVKGNYGDVRLENTAVDSGTYMATGPGLSCNPYAQLVVTGDFTVEGFFKLDKDMWLENIDAIMKKHSQSRYRMPIFGLLPDEAKLPADMGTSEKNSIKNNGLFHLRATHGAERITDFTLLYTYVDAEGAYKDGTLTLKEVGKTAAFKLPEDALSDKWHHFAVTYDSATCKLTVFIDDHEMQPATVPNGLLFPYSGQWRFGNGFNSCAFPGWMDELRLTRRVLEPAEFLKMKTGGGLLLLVK